MIPTIRARSECRVIEIGPVRIRVCLTGAETAGAIEAVELAAPAGAPGPRTHRHTRCHETFHIMEGTLRFTVNDLTFDARAGDVVNVPPGTPHSFAYPGPDAARFLSTLAPAIGIVEYFDALRELVRERMPPDPVRLAELMSRHDQVPAG